jgi:hypothetical protein
MSEIAWDFPINRRQVHAKEDPYIQTKSKMDIEMASFVLNPEMTDTPRNHRIVWLQAHPGETLTQDDVIHHINGNHDDNRPENLIKLTAKEHRQAHSKMDRATRQAVI